MADEQKNSTPTGVGPGVTGGSGDLVDGSGGDQGTGGTGHDSERDAAGMRPDERNRPSQQEAMGGSPEGKVTPVRQSGSQTGTVGGGGAGAAGSVPGGVRNVTPANDLEPGGTDVHRAKRGSEPSTSD